MRDENFVPITTVGFVTKKTVTFTGAAGAGAQGTVNLFTVTGDVMVDVIGICNTSLAGASATIRIGVAGNEGVIIATTTATDLDENMSWDDSTPSLGEVHPATANIIGNGLDIILTVGVADVTAGVVDIYCMWTPLSTDGNVTAA